VSKNTTFIGTFSYARIVPTQYNLTLQIAAGIIPNLTAPSIITLIPDVIYYLLIFNEDADDLEINGPFPLNAPPLIGLTLGHSCNSLNYHGECIVDLLANNAHCLCTDGFLGDTCENSCPECYNQGVCVQKTDSTTTCLCLVNYFGDNCQWYCSSILNCSGQGYCVMKNQSLVCNCDVGYYGSNCSLIIQPQPEMPPVNWVTELPSKISLGIGGGLIILVLFLVILLVKTKSSNANYSLLNLTENN